jgi:hypothetical protein
VHRPGVAGLVGTVIVTSNLAASPQRCFTVKRPDADSFTLRLRLRLPSPKRIETLAMPEASVARPRDRRLPPWRAHEWNVSGIRDT